jgi:hypothetical protein
VGQSNVTVPAGTFVATQVTLVIAFKANGSVDTGNGIAKVTVQGTDTLTFFGLNGVGLIKVISKAVETETESGVGTAHINNVNTSTLTSYDYLGT